MSIWSKSLGAILVVLIGALAAVCFVVSQGSTLRNTVDQYPAGAMQVYLRGVSEDRSTGVLAVLGEFAAADGHAVVRVDHELGGADDSLTGLRIGVAANSEAPPRSLGLSFLGTSLLDTSRISQLLAADPAKSIGLDANAADVIADIPQLAFAPRIAAVQLAHLIETSGTVNGTYRVIGADPAQMAELLSALETATGQTSDELRTAAQGESTDGGLLGILLPGFLVAAVVLLLLLLLFEALRSLRVLGVHVLLGKSTWRFTARLFSSIVVATAVAVVLSVALTLTLMPGYAVTPELLTAAGGAATGGAALALACVAIAGTVLVSVKPVDAILGRFSKKLLLWAVSGVYMLAVIGFSATLIFLDGPIREAGTLAEVGRSWATVADREILYHESTGDDQASFTGQSSQHAQDFYDWYASIADKPGVALIHTEYYDQATLDQWSGAYASVPEKPFWYFAASPSYLASQGFTVSADLLARAARGERIFLLPDTWTATAKSAMQAWLSEDSRITYDPSIRTRYFDKQTVAVDEYSPTTPLFTWSSDPAQPQVVTDPVILLSTPENMIPFESESLNAIGLENSYIKLSKTAAHNYTSSQYLAKFSLADNRVEFLPASDFVAGLTKTIQSVVQLFGGVIAFLGVFSLVVLIALTRLFSTIFREALAVKRMLGYPLARLFAPAIIVVGAAGVLAVVVAAASQSRSAILGNLIMLALQAALLAFLARRSAGLQLSTALKE